MCCWLSGSSKSQGKLRNRPGDVPLSLRYKLLALFYSRDATPLEVVPSSLFSGIDGMEPIDEVWNKFCCGWPESKFDSVGSTYWFITTSIKPKELVCAD